MDTNPEAQMNTKPDKIGTLKSGHMERLVLRLINECKDLKRRVRTRLRDLQEIKTIHPVRGPLNPNGRPSALWTFYQGAVRKHRSATQQLNELLRLIPH